MKIKGQNLQKAAQEVENVIIKFLKRKHDTWYLSPICLFSPVICPHDLFVTGRRPGAILYRWQRKIALNVRKYIVMYKSYVTAYTRGL